ncbi:hypothetical protein QTO34_002493 [Cnephaeus nilssonii]|uniref:Zinc finger SWIM-type containing 2 n=1 Tax=Cnephaeus nilssonii TaxID=3371016 RepID=A0AA40LM43_CNENI|nr:hypothetical protein QTO34_002493 [Eptesicus nilssonii]
MQRGGSAKAAPRRRHLSRRLSRAQDRALGGSIFLLRESGPTGFLLREEEPAFRDFRVFLGNPHTCNCPAFQKGAELCKHICWILLKKFKLPRNHESSDPHAHTEGDGCAKQKEIGPEDVCSICQEVLLEKKLPVTFCRFGCGNNVHIKCMKILANYQNAAASTSMLKCPLCREDFAPLNLILEEFKNASKLVTVAEKERLDRQLGIPCNSCKQCPIEGPCYKCAQCEEYHLCQACFDSCCHRAHAFTFREKRNQRWKSLEKRPGETEKYRDVKNDVEEQTPHLQEKPGQAHTPKHAVRALPLLMVTKNSKLLAPGLQCRLCLQAFRPGQYARLLPCAHKVGPPHTHLPLSLRLAFPSEGTSKVSPFSLWSNDFHRKCIDSWLFHKCNACPVDGQVIYNPLLWKDTAVNGRGHHSVPNQRSPVCRSRKNQGSSFLVPVEDASALHRHPPGNDIRRPVRSQRRRCKFRKLIYEYKIRQHFPRYFHDLPTGSFGKMPSQTFLPSITRKNNVRPPGTGCPRVNDAGQSQKLTEGSKRIHHNLKKILGTHVREENRRPDTSRRFRSYCQLGYN